MTDPTREIIEVLAQEADRADKHGGWSFLLLQEMARCAQRIVSDEPAERAPVPCDDCGGVWKHTDECGENNDG